MVPHSNRTYLDGSSVLWVDGEDALHGRRLNRQRNHSKRFVGQAIEVFG